MRLFKNVVAALTDKRELKSPALYYSVSQENLLTSQLKQLLETHTNQLDRKKVEDHLKLFSIGESGEENVLFELQHAQVPMLILKDLYIEYGDSNAQIDFIVLTRRFILVLEVKRLYGNIHITETGDFQRVIMKSNRIISREGMYSPINQVERHLGIIDRLLRDNKLIKHCPMNYAVSLANPKTILDISKNAPEKVKSHVIRYDQIRSFMKKEIEKASPVDFPDVRLYEIADTILKYNTIKTLNQQDYLAQELNFVEPTLKQESDSVSTTADSEKESPDVPIEDTKEILRQRLTHFRSTYAKEHNMKAYYIFKNQTLEQLVATFPQTRDELIKIEGFGPKKVEEFGDEICTIIRTTLQKTSEKS